MKFPKIARGPLSLRFRGQKGRSLKKTSPQGILASILGINPRPGSSNPASGGSRSDEGPNITVVVLVVAVHKTVVETQTPSIALRILR